MIAFRALSKGIGRARRLVLNAAAKVNLVLEVLGKRGDGYHELVTVMQAVDLSDRVTLEDADVLELTSSPGVPADGSNLALRAATALREAAGVTRGARITLDKRIPVAAGLGGGSTDAAAVLLGLNRLWRLRWPVARLDEVATGLGMDVPFFLRGGTALATGRGERVERLRGRSLGLVLVNPRFAVSTAEMYARVTPAMYTDGRHAKTLCGGLGGRSAARVAASLYNGLQEAAVAAHPPIGRMRAALLAAGALGALMSGSGPTVFGVARSFEHARQIRRRLTRGSWDCWAVRTLTGPAIRVVAG
ncbi:MAG: 4-(cytidine 5'-diphospho)-2-C-methyl-D-erythritol kinase [Candidatus Rokuibacteriota bacterium]|nr:MAG: 4-(cytidine 5'-diphospho)-2-C-methyl-D-erythritol kinase [Candidatus Rokubacteria bacterium]PYN28625.1 MAG: 4-(cytidine 5'-diphospho)-2-C-methyl-D-erythritol kinase [Candidatus Rokubacteria bacterium]